jgi:hypothetical protein
MAGLLDKCQELAARDRVAPDVIAWQGDFVLRHFVGIGARIMSRVAAEQEWTRGNLDKTEPGVIGKIPGIWPETWIAKPHEFVAGGHTFRGAQLTRTHALALIALRRAWRGQPGISLCVW